MLSGGEVMLENIGIHQQVLIDFKLVCHVRTIVAVDLIKNLHRVSYHCP
jgi:hypothetical protein